MPTYEYSCKNCGCEFDRFESISAPPNPLCAKCGEKKAERRISSGGGFLFRGDGFYATAHRKGPKPEEK